MKQSEPIGNGIIPRHIAVIMDGNGRWARSKGKARIFGHKSAIKAVRDTIEGSAEAGVKYLTLYAFSTENWNRPKAEVRALMELLVTTVNKELDTLKKNNIRLLTIGDFNSLPSSCKRDLNEAMNETRNNKKMDVILALSYSAKTEIIEAVKKISSDVKNEELSPAEINYNTFENYLETKNTPHPDLLIRTGGECRISNFLLWQLAYTELVFIGKYWPDFRKNDLYDSILEYQKRERRFGKTSEQVTVK